MMATRFGPVPILAALLVLVTLAGCGFRPLYGRNASDPTVNADLSAIYIPPLPDREGQLVHNALLVRFNRNGDAEPSRFRLAVTVVSAENPTVLQSDQTASRALVTFVATYHLFEEDISLTGGSFTRAFSYDYVPEQYSNVSARGDVAKRAADEIADEIRDRIAAYFARAAKARAAAATAPANQNQQ
jgi:LPS-assembly lipoprotein